jgi:mycofactocin system glycosyltransferase
MTAVNSPADSASGRNLRRTVPGLPVGFSIVLDAATKRLAPDVLFGGIPARVMRLSPAGMSALAELERGPVVSAASSQLARRLTDAGLAHPVPPGPTVPPDVTVLIPVHNRAAELDRCLVALGDCHPVVVVDDASTDADAVAKVCADHGARLVRRDVNGGPAAARNSGLAVIDTELVAMVDSDCLPSEGWIEALAAHLADPLVSVAAPRITAVSGRGWAGRYANARGILDQGGGPALVRPLSRVAFVPSAALVARREAVGAGFDEGMRTGEDVDLIWRLVEAGHRVRYDPAVTVTHHEPEQWRVLLERRFRYGTSAGPLAAKHPDNMPPMIVNPWPTAAVAGALTRHPLIAAAGAIGSIVQTRKALEQAKVPAEQAPRMAGGGIVQTWLAAGRYTTQLATPLLLAGLARKRTRAGAASLLLGAAVANWARGTRDLDPVSFVAGHVVDDVVYGAGVWRGAIAERTAVPLIPVTTRSLRGKK